MGQGVPQGFRVAGVHCGIKSHPDKLDLTLVVGDTPFVVAGVYTQNQIVAAPVMLDRQRTPSGNKRVLVANSGVANACTGQRGMRDALEMAELAAQTCGAAAEQALVMSTGTIGDFLPMEKIAAGIKTAVLQLGTDETALLRAAQGILTTDRQEKMAARSLNWDDRCLEIAAFAKGAGMIGPRMATMLGIILTDASLSPRVAQHVLEQAVDASFNCISVEGHMSTNDTVLLMASGTAHAAPLTEAELREFAAAVTEVCIDLARMIPDDGEGASHLITIDVKGCATTGDAKKIARAIADSPLVKTAVAGAQPNWGRILSAAGYAGVPLDSRRLELRINGTLTFQNGDPVDFDASALSAALDQNREASIELVLEAGNAQTRFWTSDLTVDYVRLNADYHT